MKSSYHIHDRKQVQCPIHLVPRPLSRAMACDSDKHKSMCDGKGLGITCNNHTRTLNPAEITEFTTALRTGTPPARVVAASALKRGTMPDPKLMKFV